MSRAGDDARRTRPPIGIDVAAQFRHPLIALGLTTAVAGMADGLAFLGYQTFVANQSGNLILLGLGVVGRYPDWPACLAAIAGFAVGAATARVAVTRLPADGRRAAVVGIVTAAVLLALWAVAATVLPGAIGWRGVALSAVGAVPMGWLSATFARTGGVTTSTTYMTGTTLQTTVAVTDTVRGQAGSPGRRVATLGTLGIACYTVGAAVGGLAWRGDAALVAVCAPALLLLLPLLRDG